MTDIEWLHFLFKLLANTTLELHVSWQRADYVDGSAKSFGDEVCVQDTKEGDFACWPFGFTWCERYSIFSVMESHVVRGFICLYIRP